MNRVPRKSSVRIVRYIGDPHFLFADELFKSFLKGNRLQGGFKGVVIGFSQKIRNRNLQIISNFNDGFRTRYDPIAGNLGNGIGIDPDACGKFGVAAMSGFCFFFGNELYHSFLESRGYVDALFRDF